MKLASKLLLLMGGGGVKPPAGYALLFTGTADPNLVEWEPGPGSGLVGGTPIQIGNDIYDAEGGGGISQENLGYAILAGVVHLSSLSSPNLSQIIFSGNSITGVTGGALINLGGGDITFAFDGNLMSIAACEQLAIDLSNNPGVGDGGSLDVANQTPPAPLADWSMAGQNAVIALQNAGWSVTTD